MATNPTPKQGDTVTIPGRRYPFEVINMGNPEEHANTAAALTAKGLYPAICTLRVKSGSQAGRYYTAFYNPAEGQFQDLIIY